MQLHIDRLGPLNRLTIFFRSTAPGHPSCEQRLAPYADGADAREKEKNIPERMMAVTDDEAMKSTRRRWDWDQFSVHNEFWREEIKKLAENVELLEGVALDVRSFMLLGFRCLLIVIISTVLLSSLWCCGDVWMMPGSLWWKLSCCSLRQAFRQRLRAVLKNILPTLWQLHCCSSDLSQLDVRIVQLLQICIYHADELFLWRAAQLGDWSPEDQRSMRPRLRLQLIVNELVLAAECGVIGSDVLRRV